MKKWTPKEIECLIDNRKRLSYVASVLGRSVCSVSCKLHELKKMEYMNSGVKWTDKDLSVLTENSHLRNSELCEMLQRGSKEISMMKYLLKNKLTGGMPVEKTELKPILIENASRGIVKPDVGASINKQVVSIEKIDSYMKGNHCDVVNDIIGDSVKKYIRGDAMGKEEAFLRSLKIID